MKIKISSREQLQSVIYTWFNEHKNCIIELQDIYLGGCIYFMSSKLPDDTTLLSMCVGETSIGDVISFDDKKSKMEWIKNKLKVIDFDNANITAQLKSADKIINVEDKEYRTYPESYRRVKKTIPVLISTIDEAQELFSRFLKNSECKTLIFSITVPIVDLGYVFTLDFVIDKIFIYGRTLISFTTTSKDTDVFVSHYLIEYTVNDDETTMDLKDICDDIILGLYRRCMIVSNEDISVYVYCNHELL